jgi:hypothetical protein
MRKNCFALVFLAFCRLAVAQQPQPTPTPSGDLQSPAALPPGAPSTKAEPQGNPNGFTIEYVHSDKKWWVGIGFNAPEQKYDNLSEFAQKQLIATMENKGFHRATPPDPVICKLKIELLSVKFKNSVFRPTVHVAANLTFEDGEGHLVYKKEYQGVGRMQGGYGEKIQMARSAVVEIVNSISGDESFNKALIAGPP